MAHNIWNDGQVNAMFCVGDRKAAWHELGQRTPNAVRWQDAMAMANLDWTVSKVQLHGALYGAPRPLDGTFGIFRSTDGAFLGTVGDQYTPIQNRYAFDFVDSLIDASDGAHYESAGALGNGERIWCLARVPADILVKDVDRSQVYLLFTTSHDGSMSATCKLSTVRVVCQNTLNSALHGAGAFVRVKHTREAERRLDQARRLMDGVTSDVRALEEKLNLLATRRLTRDSMVAILDRVFPKPADPKTNPTRRENLLADVLSLYEKNDGRNGFAEIRGTAYNLLNAITEYTDHTRGVRITDSRKGYTEQRARAENALVGTGDKLKTEALTAILELTANDPTFAPVQFAGVR